MHAIGRGLHHCGGSEAVSRLYSHRRAFNSVPEGFAGSVVDSSGRAIYVLIFAVVFEC
jgi:hypothetical protein